MTSVVVVGAGLSGLAAGYRLHQGGATVTVLESATGPGGRVQTERYGEYIIDTGPDALTAGYASYLGLVEDLGLGDRLVDTSAVIGVIRQGRVIDLDPAKLLRLPFTPALSMLEIALGGRVHPIAEGDQRRRLLRHEPIGGTGRSRCICARLRATSFRP